MSASQRPQKIKHHVNVYLPLHRFTFFHATCVANEATFAGDVLFISLCTERRVAFSNINIEANLRSDLSRVHQIPTHPSGVHILTEMSNRVPS